MKRIIVIMVCLVGFLVACQNPDKSNTSENTSSLSTLVLNSPTNEAHLNLIRRQGTLEWQWEGELADNWYYDVRVWQDGQPAFGIAWEKEPRYILNGWLLGQPSGLYYWTIAVIEGQDGQFIREVIPPPPPHQFAYEALQDIDVSPFLTMEAGFKATIYGQALIRPTVITFGPDGALYVAHYSGDILRLADNDGDGFAESVSNFFINNDTLSLVVGMVFYEDRVYVSDSGRIGYLEDSDANGQLDIYTNIVEGLPAWEYWGHSNNGILIKDDKLYVGVGSTTDHGPLKDPLEASILRMNLDGSELEVFATGLRNPYDLAMSPEGEIFTADNNPDQLDDTLRYLPSEEINHIQEGRNYGFPNVFTPPTNGYGDTQPPAVQLLASVGSAGLTYYRHDRFPEPFNDGLYLATWGGNDNFRSVPYGFRVIFISLTPTDDTFTGDWQNFARFEPEAEISRPIDVTVGPDGHLYIAEYLTGLIFRVDYVGISNTAISPDAAITARGRDLYFNGTADAPSCHTCHNNAAIAPLLNNIGTIAAQRIEGQSATDYLYQSIVAPNAYIVEGYSANLMYQQYQDVLSPEQIDALIAYMLALKTEE